MIKKINLFGLVLIFTLFSCNLPAKKEENKNAAEAGKKIYSHVSWSKNANIYEVNIRQYTPEGTFAAFEKHMPRLKEMGVNILWIMPIHPISEKNRKGSLGSYYAVQDYQKVNPEFGTLDDFKHMVTYAHELGMYVIIDWVANHTGWDNWLIEQHIDWYTHDSVGNIIAPVADWSDVADLNYDVPEMREYMIQSLEYWVKETNIDGYRCDVAGMVPVDFWIDARQELDSIKPVFMLAEHEGKEVLQAFDMIYGWEFHHIMNGIAQGKKGIKELDSYFAKIDTVYDADEYHMNFTSNHDENSWNGTEFDRMGDAVQAMAVLSATVPGMPLIYSGQEDKLSKKLSFFEKDAIEWKDFSATEFYSKLLKLKTDNKALWNGETGGNLEKIENSNPELVYSFHRVKDKDEVIVILNFSAQKQTITLANSSIEGKFGSLFTNTAIDLNNKSNFELDPWGYTVLVRKN